MEALDTEYGKMPEGADRTVLADSGVEDIIENKTEIAGMLATVKGARKVPEDHWQRKREEISELLDKAIQMNTVVSEAKVEVDKVVMKLAKKTKP